MGKSAYQNATATGLASFSSRGVEMIRSVKRILIVEDNDLNLMLLNDLLKVQGYEIFKTSVGLEAINLARDKQPDLILMDIKLPDICGLDVTRRLKQDDLTKSIPIIAITAFATPGDETKALESGCDGYITKPIDVRLFPSQVGAFCGSAGTLP